MAEYIEEHKITTDPISNNEIKHNNEANSSTTSVILLIIVFLILLALAWYFFIGRGVKSTATSNTPRTVQQNNYTTPSTPSSVPVATPTASSSAAH